MTLFLLSEELYFPHPRLSDDDGLLALGGDLSIERLVLAYRKGIFPWYSEDSPILWWSPDPRLVLFPHEIHLSKRLKRTIRQHKFRITFDTAFREVIEGCAQERPNSKGTWIVPEMSRAYRELHTAGYAHSVEVWIGEKLVGGIYGVSLGGCFFGESMFSRVSNASKVALATLADYLQERGFDLVDCQVTSDHLLSLGAREVSRNDFLALLEQSMKKPTRKGRWDPGD
jgi:leucyl/phenylalanyl-tRNA--protein transferase